MATKLKIVDTDNNFFVINNLDLELKLNLSSKNLEYVHIGDYIYDFFNRINIEGQPPSILRVTNEQYKFLYKINNMSIKEIN